ncbi:MAG: transporter substrate-binding domain-containing protein [Spirochaetes bacterium]|nr:transporter substrate-binding domain-containing protein [Spirochaetota bacterium]
MKNRILPLLLLCASLFAARSWEEIVASKELRIAIRVREGVLSPEKNSGFHYDLARAFAKKQGLTLKLVVKSTLNDYFTSGLFNEADVVCDNVTILPERAEKMKFVEFLAIKQILVTKKGHIPLTTLARLADETIIVAKDSSYYAGIQEKEKEAKVAFKYFFSATTADQIKDLMADKGTVTILDSNLAAEKLLEDELSLHKAISARQMIGWGVEKSQATLALKLTEFLEEARRDAKSGLFSNVWTKYIQGISYDEYLKIAQ